MDVLKEGGFQKITLKPVFVLSSGYAHLPDGLIFVYAKVPRLSGGKFNVIIPAPDREVEVTNLSHSDQHRQQCGQISRLP